MSSATATCGSCLRVRPVGAQGMIGWHERWDDAAGRWLPCSGVGWPPVWFSAVSAIRADLVPVGERL